MTLCTCRAARNGRPVAKREFLTISLAEIIRSWYINFDACVRVCLIPLSF